MQILGTKESVYLRKESNSHVQDWFGTPTWPPVLLFWNTNMAVVTSCENAILCLSSTWPPCHVVADQE